MTQGERARLIESYKNGYAEVADALNDISEPELDFSHARGKWSSREIVHHLADSEMTSAIRLRKLLVESSPYIQGYDQDAFAKKLHYGERPIEPSLRAVEAARKTTAELLDRMTDADWKRAGEHSDSGPYSAETWLEIYAVHAHNHVEQIRRNRTAYRKGE